MRMYLLFAGVCFLAACNNGSKQEVSSMAPVTKDSPATAAPKQDLTYAYTADYSSKFEIGDAKNAQMIMNLWKDWENGDLSKAKDKFADTVTMYLADGTHMWGPRDTIIAMSQKFRSGLPNVKNRVDAFIPLKSTDKNENWVAVWGMEYVTDKKGKMDSTDLHEIWRLNKDGKADLMRQFISRSVPQKK